MEIDRMKQFERLLTLSDERALQLDAELKKASALLAEYGINNIEPLNDSIIRLAAQRDSAVAQWQTAEEELASTNETIRWMAEIIEDKKSCLQTTQDILQRTLVELAQESAKVFLLQDKLSKLELKLKNVAL